jgi:hypothetical protein
VRGGKRHRIKTLIHLAARIKALANSMGMAAGGRLTDVQIGCPYVTAKTRISDLQSVRKTEFSSAFVRQYTVSQQNRQLTRPTSSCIMSGTNVRLPIYNKDR